MISKQQDILPRFNPEGTLVAYLSVVGKNKTELHVIDVNSKKDKILVQADNIFDFSWSPDGDAIALSLVAGEMSHINLVGVKDKNVVTLLKSSLKQSSRSNSNKSSNSNGKNSASQKGGVYLIAPSWSPDGKKLAFIKHPLNASESKALYVMDISSAKEQRISSEKVQIQAPIHWSNDSKKLLYSGLVGYRYYYDETKRDRVYEGGMQIFLATPGQDTQQLTHGDHLHSYPVFSPDQKRIAFLYSEKLGDVRTVSLKSMDFNPRSKKPEGLKELYNSVARDSKILWH